MPIIAHGIIADEPLSHMAWLDFRPPCIAEAFTPIGVVHWHWALQFIDTDHDGYAEVLLIRMSHRTAPHSGEPSPNVLGPIIYLNPCAITSGSRILIPDPHGFHEDRLSTHIERISMFSSRRRLTIVAKHTSPDARIDIPDITNGRGILRR